MAKKKEIKKVEPAKVVKKLKLKEITLDEFVEQVFKHRIIVVFEKPTRGVWDGTRKSLEFVPEQVEVDGEPAIRWSEGYGNNFIVMCRGRLDIESCGYHLDTAMNYILKEKKPKRTATIRKV